MTRKQLKGGPGLSSHIDLVARGSSDDGKRFVLLKINGDVGEKEVLVRETRVKEFTDQLEKAGASIISARAFRELEGRLQAFAETPTSFEVSTRIELRDEGIALPGGPYPKTDAFKVCLDDVPPSLQAKFMKAGTLTGWKQLTKLASGNTRFITALCLEFVGPLSFVKAIPHVGVQLLGKGGEGTSSLLAATSSVWGWDPDPSVANEMGFGTTWNSTSNAFERTASAYNQTCLHLNETQEAGATSRQFAETILSVVMKVAGAVGKARLTEDDPRRWYAPLLSTSNVSVVALARAAGKEQIPPFVDRLMDVPGPPNKFGMFEKLHGFPDVAAFCVEIKRIAAENHGVAGRRFIKKLYADIAGSKNDLIAWLDKRVAFYVEQAQKRIVSVNDRDLTRVHGRCAVIYAAGRLAAEYGILPFKRKAILRAVLACERAHVELVERELGGQAHGTSHVERLRNYLRENRATFVDLRKGSCDHAAAMTAIGFIGDHKGNAEFWLRDGDFQKIAGGKTAGETLKADLMKLGVLATEKKDGGRLRTVARRFIPNAKKSRTWVVAIPLTFVEGETMPTTQQ